jgi:hypothetical protein
MAYQGFVTRVPVGMQGFSGSKNPSQMQPGHLKVVEGVSLYGGVMQKQGGAQKLNVVSLVAAILAGISWRIDDVTSYDIVALSDGTVKRGVVGTFATTLKSGMNAYAGPAQFVPGGGETVGDPARLFLFTGTNQVQVLDAAATAFGDISTPPSDWDSSYPTFGFQHLGRMWGGGNASDPHRIYYSNPADHEDFVTTPAAGTLAVFPGEGDKLVGGVSFRDSIVLFKYPQGIYVINTSDSSPANWAVTKLTTAVGSLNPLSFCQTNNDIAYMDIAGAIHLISATNTFGDVMSSDVSKLAYLDCYIHENATIGSLNRAVSAWYPAKQELWFFIPGLGSIANDIHIIGDFNNPQTGARFLLSRRDSAKSLWMCPDADHIPRPVIGDATGTVWLLDHPTLTKDGEAYQMRWETADTDLAFVDPSLGSKNKNFQFLEVVSEPKGEWNLTVQVFIDDNLTDTLSYGMGTGGASLGSFEIGASVLGSIVARSDRKPITGSGRRIRLTGYNDGAGQDVSLADFYVSFTASDESTR